MQLPTRVTLIIVKGVWMMEGLTTAVAVKDADIYPNHDPAYINK